jgi:hypothetical protein
MARLKTIGVDLSVDRPQITCDGETVRGVTRAELVLEPDSLPTLVITLTMFEVVGGTMPYGWPLPGTGKEDTP